MPSSPSVRRPGVNQMVQKVPKETPTLCHSKGDSTLPTPGSSAQIPHLSLGTGVAWPPDASGHQPIRCICMMGLAMASYQSTGSSQTWKHSRWEELVPTGRPFSHTESLFRSSTAHSTASGTGTCPAPADPCPAAMAAGGYALSLDRKVWEMEIPTVSDGHCCSHHHLPPSWSETVWLHLAEKMGFVTCCSGALSTWSHLTFSKKGAWKEGYPLEGYPSPSKRRG